MIDFVVGPLNYPFMVRGLVAVVMVGIVCAVVGTYVVLRGLAFFGDALAHAILRSMSADYLPRLRTVIKTIPLRYSSRPLILALLKYGNLNDFNLMLGRISRATERIDFWNHMELGRTAARQIEKSATRIPSFLLDLVARKEFWEYIPREQRTNLPHTDLLPIKSLDNRSLYLRLAGYGMIGAAGKKDQEHLIELSAHEYRSIARAAAIRLVRLLGENAFRNLTTKVDDSIQNRRDAISIADALRSAEIQFYGLANLW